MCKWVRALLPLRQHNMCTEAQSCLRKGDSQISQCGAKPVALFTGEPLGVFNSPPHPPPPLLYPSLYVQMRPVCLHVCVQESPLPVRESPCLLIRKFSRRLHSQLNGRGCGGEIEKKDVRDVQLLVSSPSSCTHGAYKWANLRIKAPRIQLQSYECKQD